MQLKKIIMESTHLQCSKCKKVNIANRIAMFLDQDDTIRQGPSRVQMSIKCQHCNHEIVLVIEETAEELSN